MIDITATKGYGYIKVEIYHNNKNIDFDSIQEEFNEDIKKLQDSEKSILNKIEDREPETLRNQIIEIIKEADNRQESVSIESLKAIFHNRNITYSQVEPEINRLLEDGFIFEPKVNYLRWLGN